MKSSTLNKIFSAIILLTLSLTVSAETQPFRFRIQGEPETLDWNKAHTPIETNLLMNLMEGLVAFDSSLNVVPALAESWSISKDGKTYTFKIRKGVKWSDGVPLKAQHFVHSWRRLLAEATAAPYAYFLFDIEKAEAFSKGLVKDFNQVGIKAKDDRTLKITLSRPLGFWIYIPTFWVTFPIREDLIEKYKNQWTDPGKLVTIGPFVLDSHTPESKVVLKANPHYYGTRGNVNEVQAVVVKDDSTALSLYESGKLDFITDISTLDIERLSGRTDLKVFPYLKTAYLGFVINKKPFDQVALRRAIAMAIDKQKIPEILRGGQSPATSFCPPNMPGWDPKIGLKFDPAKAKLELKGAGIDASKLPPLEMIVNSWEKPMRVAEYIQAELKKNLGLTVSLRPFDHKTYRAQLDLHAFPMIHGTWSADYPDPDNFLSVFLGESGNNRIAFKDSRYDQDVILARGILDQKQRIKAYSKLQKKLTEEDAVIVPLYYEPNMGLVKDRIKGLELNPLNYLYLRKIQEKN